MAARRFAVNKGLMALMDAIDVMSPAGRASPGAREPNRAGLGGMAHPERLQENRGGRDRPKSGASLRRVRGKICAKIGWPVPQTEGMPLLTEIYSAVRAFLERERLFGQPRERKTGPPS